MLNFYRLLNTDFILWECIFCIIITFCVLLTKNNPNKEKQKWMLCLQVSTTLLLLSDVVAYSFRGVTSEAGYYAVRVSNFLACELVSVIMLFFQQYLCSYLGECEHKNWSLKFVSILAMIGAVLAVVSQFTDLYYYIDADNICHANPAIIILTILPILGMLIDFSLLLYNRKRFRVDFVIAMGACIIIPGSAAIFEIMYNGYQLLNEAIGCSVIIMYVIYTFDQNSELERLAKSKEIIAEKLQISSILNQCVTELSSGLDIDKSINNLLQIINNYFDADRCYIFEINFQRNILVNTYEYTRKSIKPQIDNLQEVPVSIIDNWMDNFKKSKPYFIASAEQEKGYATYDMLVEQDIYRLLAVPLIKNNKIYGFMGVDNPKKNYDDDTLLSVTQFFVINRLEQRDEKKYLEYLSYKDKLTEVYNRNKYIELIDKMKGKKICQANLAYIDLNGLKKINDNEGHKAGDNFIKNAATIINTVFQDDTYRVGGDEFVIITHGMKKDVFFKKMHLLREKMMNNGISCSIGMVWLAETDDLEESLKVADARMYKEKEQYYRVAGRR